MAAFQIQTDRGLFHYETDGARLTGPDGALVDLSRLGWPYGLPATPEGGEAFSPEAPVLGKRSPRLLKIQLGLGCNYACSYCSQAGQKEVGTSAGDAREFLAGLDRWLTEPPEKIEFWGGEPLLYWHKIMALAPALRARFPAARLSMVTNGTLLNDERAALLDAWGFTLAVSHDGPGQPLRGEDPFEDPAWLDMMRRTFRRFGERITFNTVITPQAYRLLDIIFWFEIRMGFEVKVNVEDVVTDYGGAPWKPEDLRLMVVDVRDHVTSGLALIMPRLRWSVQTFLRTLATGARLDGMHQVCGMDQRDALAVDLLGNVLTCQNVGAESGHRIGTVGDLAAVRLDTGRSWAARPNCRSCPVVHLCRGSCLFLDGEEFVSSCHASYHFCRAVIEGAIQLLTGARVLDIDGYRPPPPRKTITIVAG